MSHELHSRSVGEKTHVIELQSLAGLQGLDHGTGVVHLHANHFDLRANGLDVIGHSRDQTATAHGHKHRVEGTRDLSQNLHGHRALARDHIGVVKGMHKSHAFLFFQRQGVLMGIAVALAKEHDPGAQGLNGIDLDARGGDRHHDGGFAAELLCRQRHALGMVASRGADDAFLELDGAQVGHFVVGPPELEAEHRLLVLAL